MEETQHLHGNSMQSWAMIFCELQLQDVSGFILFSASRHPGIESGSERTERRGERWSAARLLFDATGFLNIFRVFKGGLDKLTEQALHVTLAAGKETLQECNVSAVGRQQHSNIRQALDSGQREGCVSRKYKISDFVFPDDSLALLKH